MFVASKKSFDFGCLGNCLAEYFDLDSTNELGPPESGQRVNLELAEGSVEGYRLERDKHSKPRGTEGSGTIAQR